MKSNLLICNDDGIQMIHACPPGRAEAAVRDWVNFFLLDCGVDLFSFCTARPDKTHHETQVGERDFSNLDEAPSQSQLHYKQILDEFRNAGTDILYIVSDQVHQHGKKVLASIRMADIHHASDIYSFLAPRFMRDHPEWRIQRTDGTRDAAMDYAHEGVRAHRLDIINELANDYEIDGIELDFMRSCRYSATQGTASFSSIMTKFVGQIREILNQASERRGVDRLLLSVRVPPALAECPGLGLDPESWIRAGWIDSISPTDFMFLDYGTRVEEYVEICKKTDCKVYPCVNPFAAEWVDHRAVNSYTPNPVNFNRRIFYSEEHLRGLMRNYYSWGADGVYTFNFCCETIDNRDWVRHSHQFLRESPEDRARGPASYFYLPLWRKEQSPSGSDQSWRTLRIARGDRSRHAFHFRLADGRQGESLTGRLRFRIYNLHDQERVFLDLNGEPIPTDTIIERRKTNIHVAADRRFPGMHLPPHIAWELDIQNFPPLRGDNELGITFAEPDPSIMGEIMLEALEIDVGWTGHPQSVGYLVD